MTIASETESKQSHHETKPTEGESASAHGATGQGHKTQFTNTGPIPPVMPASDDGPSEASASDRAFGHVTVSGLNVRSTPAKADDNIIGGLHAGAKVETKSRKGAWLEIEHPAGQAFVHGAFVHVDGVGPAAPHDGDAHHEVAAPPDVAKTPAPPAPIPIPYPNVAHADAQAAPAPIPAQSVAHADTPAPTSELTPTTNAPASATPHAIQHPNAPTFETIEHTRVEVNHDDEGKVLSDIRAFKQQFDPHWLVQIQKQLQVGDATGAFNTETLRAMRDVSKEKLTAKKITSHAYLTALGTQLGVQGEPFRPEVDADGHEAADHAKTDPADLAAQSLHYADYHSYRTQAMKKLTFLGVRLDQGISDGKAHPLLASRIAAAEAYLVQRFGSEEKAIQGTGWSKKAGASYAATDAAAHDPKDPKSHMHTMGMAIDIDPDVNPYTMPKGDGAPADWIYWFYKTGFELGHRLGFGGDELDLTSLYGEGKSMSSEELHEHMLASSQSFARTVELSEKSDEELKTALLAAKPAYKDGNGEHDIPHLIEKWFHPAKKIFHDSKGGRKFHETMTESKELIVALRDAGGLNWGGTEMSQGQNGDFMHFDTRNDELGHRVYQTGYDAQQDRKAKLAKEAKEAKDGKDTKK